MVALMDNPILLCMLIPLLGGCLILLTGNKPNLRETVTLVTAATLFWNVLGIYETTQAGRVVEMQLFELLSIRCRSLFRLLFHNIPGLKGGKLNLCMPTQGRLCICHL